MKQYIAARTRQELITYCHQKGLNLAKFKHIYKAEQLRGIRNETIIVLNYNRLDYELKQALLTAVDLEIINDYTQ